MRDDDIPCRLKCFDYEIVIFAAVIHGSTGVWLIHNAALLCQIELMASSATAQLFMLLTVGLGSEVWLSLTLLTGSALNSVLEGRYLCLELG